MTNLSSLAGLAKLTHLELRRLPATALPALASHLLTQVDFTGTLFRDLSPLYASTTLANLKLPKETTPAAIETLTKKLPNARIGVDRGKGLD